MNTVVVPIPVQSISDWPSFHTVFSDLFGFPDDYDPNMNAWIHCMSYADDQQSGMMTRTVQPGELLTLQVDDASNFAVRCPEQYRALVNCTAFVNYRRVERGSRPVLSLLVSGIFL